MQDTSDHLAEQSLEEKLSIRLSYLLRHAALDEFPKVYRNGFVPLFDLLASQKLSTFSESAIRGVLTTSLSKCVKGGPRFELITHNGVEYARARYAHTVALSNLPLLPGEVVTVPALSQLSTRVVARNIKQFDLQSFPDNLVLQQLITELRKDGKLSGTALKTVLVSGLESVDFHGIYVTEGNLRQLGNTCTHLKHLSLSGCSYVVNQNMVQFLTNRLRHLAVLDLSNCTQLNDATVATIAKNCDVLETLTLVGWTELSTRGLDTLASYASGIRAANKRDPKASASLSSAVATDASAWRSRLTLLDIRKCPRISCVQAREFHQRLVDGKLASGCGSGDAGLTLLHEVFDSEIHFRNMHDAHFGALSNFSPALLSIDGKTWPSVTHYYQAQKFKNTPIEEAIRNAPTAEAAFEMGTSTHDNHNLRADWESVKVNVMYRASRAKIDQHESIRKLLLATEDATLVHKTPGDAFWGVSVNELSSHGWVRRAFWPQGPSTNVLGCIYMDIRAELLHGIEPPCDVRYAVVESVES